MSLAIYFCIASVTMFSTNDTLPVWYRNDYVCKLILSDTCYMDTIHKMNNYLIITVDNNSDLSWKHYKIVLRVQNTFLKILVFKLRENLTLATTFYSLEIHTIHLSTNHHVGLYFHVCIPDQYKVLYFFCTLVL